MVNSDQARDDTDEKSSRSPSVEVAEQLIESRHATRWPASSVYRCAPMVLDV